jgi:hypothetical protein
MTDRSSPNPAAKKDGQGQDGLIRLGGLAIIAGLAIHIVLNSVLKEFPPENPTVTELQSYLSNEAGLGHSIGNLTVLVISVPINRTFFHEYDALIQRIEKLIATCRLVVYILTPYEMAAAG